MHRAPSRLWLHSLLGLSLIWSGTVLSQTPSSNPKPVVVSIVIDDLGNDPREGRRALALPGPVAVAVLPHTAYGITLAEEAYRAGKEVLLHLPMDPDNDIDAAPGPGRLETQMSAREIVAMFTYDLQTVPHAVGVNNHMGSRLTQNANSMSALMRALRTHGGLFFLDSRTSPRSVAARIAVEHEIPALERDVFLDNERGEDNVWRSIQRMERLLAARGHAIAIGHPYPETLAALERWLPTLAARGIRVVPFSVMLEQHKRLPQNADRPAATRAGL